MIVCETSEQNTAMHTASKLAWKFGQHTFVYKRTRNGVRRFLVTDKHLEKTDQRERLERIAHFGRA